MSRLFRFEFNGECNYRGDYVGLCGKLNGLIESKEVDKALALMGEAGRKDLFFFCYFLLDLPVNHPWLVDRIREVESENNYTMDLWAREHWKSTLATFGLNLQEIVKDSEITIGIFSHTRGLAKSHLRKIKHAAETNERLKLVYPEVFYENPERESPKWSEDDGLIFKRKGVYLECTVEAWGLTDGMPTGKHFKVLDYDDIVTEKNVTTPEQIIKTAECFALSSNLGKEGGKVRGKGTRYHFNDIFATLKQQSIWKFREYPAEEGGVPVLFTRESLEARRIKNGPYQYSCQYLLNPVADELQEFKPTWLKYWTKLPKVNKYILCDPASRKTKKSDYSVYVVIGIDAFRNYYLIDMVRKRLNLKERWTELRDLAMSHPTARKVGYEKSGMQADSEYFEQKKKEEGVNFKIEDITNSVRKETRIRQLVPAFSEGKFYLPYQLMQDGENLVQTFLNEEFFMFPYSPHDDMLDAMSMVFNEKIKAKPPVSLPVDKYSSKPRNRPASWRSV